MSDEKGYVGNLHVDTLDTDTLETDILGTDILEPSAKVVSNILLR
jgi:hypothetical protein